MNARVDQGLAANALDTRVNRTQKLLTQPRSPPLIPDISFDNIEFSFWRNNEFSCHAWRGPFVSLLPRTGRRPGSSEGSPFYARVPVSARRTRPPACPG